VKWNVFSEKKVLKGAIMPSIFKSWPTRSVGKNLSQLTLHIAGIIFFLDNQQDAPIIQIYSVIKLYMFRASSLPIIRSFALYIRRW